MLPLDLATTCACFGPAEESSLAWQLWAGLPYRQADGNHIDLQYAWLNRLIGLKPERDTAPSVQYERRRFGAITLGYIRPF